MKISALRISNITFKENKDKELNRPSEVAIIAGGAGGTALTARVSNLNRTALTVTRGTTKAKSAFNGLTKNVETFSDGIFRCIKDFAMRLKLDKLPLLKPIGRALTSAPMRRVSGFFGGAIAFATTIFGLVETCGIFGELAKK